MRDKPRERLSATNAIWVGDYERAFALNTKILEAEKPLDALSLYSIYFELAVIGTILGKLNLSKAYIDRLEEVFSHVEEILENIEDRTEQDIETIESSTLKQFLKTRHFDHRKMDSLLNEFFPREEGVLAMFISPRYSRASLRSAIRSAKKVEVPQIIEEGIFRFTHRSELYRVVGRAYSTLEIKLETLHNVDSLRVLIENPNVYFVEDENLGIIAGIQRDGLVLCHYLLRSSEDTQGPTQIRAFLRRISRAVSKE